MRTQALLLESYNSNIIRVIKGLEEKEVELPPLKPNELLIELHASPVNPSDIAFLQGGYNIVKELPVVPGFEASGNVVQCGSKVPPRNYMNKKVSCFSQSDGHGTWGRHFIAKIGNCVVLEDDFDMDQAACLMINPLTAIGLMQFAEKKKATTIIQTAAGGQLANFIRILAKKRNLRVINIVRKDQTCEQLKATGNKYVLNSNAVSFNEKLQAMAKDFGASICLDAVGGELSGNILSIMPPHSSMVIYGGLSVMPVGNIDTLEIIFHGKELRGFNLNHWLDGLKKEDKQKVFETVKSLIHNGTFHNIIRDKFPLKDIFRAVRTYIGDMSGGKILLHP